MRLPRRPGNNQSTKSTQKSSYFTQNFAKLCNQSSEKNKRYCIFSIILIYTIYKSFVRHLTLISILQCHAGVSVSQTSSEVNGTGFRLMSYCQERHTAVCWERPQQNATALLGQTEQSYRNLLCNLYISEKLKAIKVRFPGFFVEYCSISYK